MPGKVFPLAALAVMLSAGSASAFFHGGVVGPPNPYYCLNCETSSRQGGVLAQRLAMSAEAVQQTIEQIQMVQHMVANLEKYGVTPLGLRHTVEPHNFCRQKHRNADREIP